MQPSVSNISTSPSPTNDAVNSSAPRPSLSTLYQRASDTLPGFLDSSSPSRPQNVVNDPFDYEQKYAPDEQYAEMSPKARVFRVYNDESLKYDTEMVNGWREGLDMLLLFAALFSAVVTTFVTSTCPSMRVDNSEVANSLMSEMLSVQHAMLHIMIFGPKDVQTVPSTVTSFHPKASDLWVNGLWFASLGLSLATTLLAVLAKQWIHQYTSFTSGSPRDRARIRHFRYTALQKWHVPIFIELLPVLMHAALGLFFVGLVVYLCSLNIIMAVNMALTGAAAFGTYSISAVLPVFYTDCPYKIPLSIHSFVLFSSIRHWARRWVNAKSVTPSSPPPSLRDVELETVSLKGDVMDASALGWLFNVTANLSVESIIIQALGGLPLQSIPLIAKAGSEGIASVLKAINDHSHLDQPRDKFERFQRAALLFENQEPEVKVLPICTEPSLYSHLRGPSSAIQFITANTIGPADDRLDSVLWAKLFSTAMRPGTTWLRIDHDEPSRVWAELLSFAVVFHNCDRCNCKRKKQPLLSFPLQEVRKEGVCTGVSGRNCSVPLLSIDTDDNSTTDRTSSLEYALSVNMLPSYLAWLLRVGFPGVKRSPDNYTASLPDDMFLCLTMLQTPSVQKTSSLYQTWVLDDPISLALLESGERPSPFRQILNVIKEYTINIGIGVSNHVDVDRATILAMQNVMSSELFGSSMAILLDDEALIVRSLFKGLNWRLYKHGIRNHDFSWLTTEITQKVLRVAFEDPRDPVESICNIMHYLLRSNVPGHIRGIESVYTLLLERGWLQGLGTNFSSPSVYRGFRYTDEDAAQLHIWTDRYTGFLVGFYVDGLSTLAFHAPSLHRIVFDDLSKPENLSTVCKLLLLSDVDTQSKLWRLADEVRVPHWDNCLQELVSFSVSDQARTMYTRDYYSPGVGVGGTTLRHLPPGAFYTVATTLAKDIGRGWYTPPRRLPNELGDPCVEFAKWYLNNGVVFGNIY